MRQRVSARRYQTEHRSEYEVEGPDLRRRKSYPFEGDTLLPEGWRDFFDSHIAASLLPHLKRQRLALRLDAASRAAHALVVAGLRRGCVADSRTAGKTSRVYLNAWDALVAAGFSHVQVGSEKSGKVTRYAATHKLLTLQRRWDLNLVTNTTLEQVDTPLGEGSRRDKRLTVFKTGRRAEDNSRQENEVIHIPDYARERGTFADTMRKIKGLEARLNRINRINLRHSWMATTWDNEMQREIAYQPNVVLRQFFTGDLYRAGRLYSWGLSGQSIPSRERHKMLIDNEPVAELDFSAMAVRMLYNLRDIDPPVHDDLYLPHVVFEDVWHDDQITRADRRTMRRLVKLATTIMWNTASKQEARSAVQAKVAGNDDFQDVLVAAELNVGNLLDRIECAHPSLDGDFYSLAASEIQTLDGQIMLDILDTCTAKDIPALGIHDSVVCKALQTTEVERIMNDTYREHMGYRPVVRVVTGK